MTEAQKPSMEYAIQRIYVKDLSFESPGAPDLFRKQWQPEIALDVHTHHNKLDKLEDGVYEIVLTVTVTAKAEQKTAFIIEVKQAGIFTAKNFPEPNLNHYLNSFCPQVLFPYAREVISDVVTRGSFPQLLLAPINFDQLYRDHLEKQKT